MRARGRRDAPAPITIEGLPAHTNLEAERSVLGAMLADPDHVVDLVQDQGLREEDFFAPAHQVIFRAVTTMRETGQAIDPSTLLAWLNDRKLQDAGGGAALIGELASGVISVFTAPTHIQQVKDKSLLRELQQACAQIVVGAHERPHEVQTILDEAERDILEIRGRRETQGITRAAEVAPKTIQMIEQLIRGKGHYSGIPSGFDELDQMTTGFKGGEMIVITALRGVAAEISDLPLLLDESSLLSIGQLRARARRLKKMHNIGIIFVDYLQLLTSGTDRARESRQVEVSEISRGLKALAMELNIPVVVLAQLNRKPEETNQDPALHHLRESGSIEQDADVVMLLSRENSNEDPEATEGSSEEGENAGARPAQRGIVCKLNIAKQRNGPTDRIRLLFQPRFTRFDSLPREAR